jgi:glutamine amidotransferase-like uncharacterized protein
MDAIGRLGVAALGLALVAVPGCRSRGGVPLTASHVPPILLFDGDGTSPNDVTAFETILRGQKLEYSTVSSSQLNEMSASRLGAYQLLIIPGGNFIDMGHGLTAGTVTKLHDAVQGGLGYLGVCAGAFLAGSSTYYPSLNLTSGVRFGFYSDENRGIRKAAVAIAQVGGPTLEQYWEDGPQLSGWGAVVGKYPDGTPAIVEGSSGQGWVILSGVHPEAPASWRHGLDFTTPAEADHAYAATLIDAALHRTSLPHE